MIKYHTDKYGRYNGRQSQARTNPNYTPETHLIGDKYIYNPRTESLLEPEPVVSNEASILVDREWVKVIDRIGQHYYEQNGTKVEIVELDIDVPGGCIQDDPDSIYHEVHDGSIWIENTVKKETDEAEQLRQSEINTEYNTHEWKGRSPLWIRNRIKERVGLMSLPQSDKDILSSLLIKNAMLNIK